MTQERENLNKILSGPKDFGLAPTKYQNELLEELFHHGITHVGGRLSAKREAEIKEVKKILKKAGVHYKTGNDAPNGGREGNFIQLTSQESLAEIDAEKEILLQQFFEAGIESWHLRLCTKVNKEWGDEAYNYLLSMFKGDITFTTEEIYNSPADVGYIRHMDEEAAKRNNVECSLAFRVAWQRYSIRHQVQMNFFTKKQIKLKLRKDIPFSHFFLLCDRQDLDFTFPFKFALEKEGLLAPQK